MINKCFLCDKITYVPFHVTEINDGKVISYHMCKQCGTEYTQDAFKQKQEPMKKLDLTHIKTPEELLNFLSGVHQAPKSDKEPCVCGMTIAEFDDKGKFGCAQCYEHFDEKMEELAYPWHGARQHVGKQPKRQMAELMENDPVEKLKLLKLKYAKSLELEEYEKLADLKKQIDEISPSCPSTSEDQ